MSNFTGSDPTVDQLPNPNTTQIEHRDDHIEERGSIRAVQQWIRTYVLPIFANGWVTSQRIATGAVTDSKIDSVSISKLTGIPLFTSLRSVSTVSGDGGVRAGPTAIGHPVVLFTWVRGVMASNGTVAVNHQIPLLHRRIVDAEFWARGNSGEARNMLPTGFQVNGDQVIVTGGPAGVRFRVGIWYMADPDSAWP